MSQDDAGEIKSRIMTKIKNQTAPLVILISFLILISGVSRAVGAERKAWVMLTNCQFVVHKDNDGDSCGA